MTATVERRKQDEATYVMPSVQVGDIVLWYPKGDPKMPGQPAMVTSVSRQTIACNIFSRAFRDLKIREGARHITDPQATRPELADEGAWDYTFQAKLLMDFEERIHELEKKKKTEKQ